jgi:hypothetical protein
LFFRLFTDPEVRSSLRRFIWAHFMSTVDPEWDRLGSCNMGNSATRLLYISIVDFWMMLVAREGAWNFIVYCAWFCSRLCVCFQL